MEAAEAEIVSAPETAEGATHSLSPEIPPPVIKAKKNKI